MNKNKGTKLYTDKVKEILNKSDSLEGCKNRMCTTDDSEELLRLHSFLTLYAADLYRLNRERLFIAEYGEAKIDLLLGDRSGDVHEK